MTRDTSLSVNFQPRARRDDVVLETIEDEVIVYDLRRHKAHSLNATAGQVWEWCDGATSSQALALKAAERWALPEEQAEALVWLSLERLAEAKLLDGPLPGPGPQGSSPGLTRRDLLRIVGAATLLPVVYTLVAPSAAHAQSCAGLGDECRDSGLPCCPGLTCRGHKCRAN